MTKKLLISGELSFIGPAFICNIINNTEHSDSNISHYVAMKY